MALLTRACCAVLRPPLEWQYMLTRLFRRRFPAVAVVIARTDQTFDATALAYSRTD